MNSVKNTILIALLFFFGCEFTKTDSVQNSLRGLENNVNYIAKHPVMGKLEVVTAVAVDPAVQTLVDSMKDVPKEEAAKLYTAYSGLALYIEQTEKVTTTLRVEQLITETIKDFGFEKGSQPAYSTARKAFLDSRGWKKARKIVKVLSSDAKEAETQVTRDSVVADIRVISEAARMVRDAK